ncbi:MAG: hypothetical protein KGL39_45600, partial [Patescibacteria group bacterium]|nr:hypothetical protein [Patescibacteria group bacterium]
SREVYYFATSSDGVNWTQLGNLVYDSTAITTFNSSSVFEVGSDTVGTASLFAGTIYLAQVYDIGNSRYVFNAPFSSQAKLAGSFTESGAAHLTVTINTSGDTGARICGARDLYQGTAANQPIYLPYSGTKYGYLNMVSGNYFSTPDATALHVVNDIDMIAEASLSNWASASRQALVGRWASASSKLCYLLSCINGNLEFWISLSGSDNFNAASTTTVGFLANTIHWVRAKRTYSDGVVTFYTSADGVTWSQLGTTVVLKAGSNIATNASPLEVGTTTGGAANESNGAIYRAQVWNGISTSGGALVFDFNPQATYTSGTTFADASSNAATITLNGGATIVTNTGLYFNGTSSYMKAASWALSQPENVYFTGKQNTWSSDAAIFDGNTANAMLLVQGTSSPLNRLYAGGSDSATNVSFPLATSQVWTAIFNGSSGLLRLNRTTATAESLSSNNATGFTIGGKPTPTNYSNIFFNEALLYDQFAQDSGTQNAIVNWEIFKWGVSP